MSAFNNPGGWVVLELGAQNGREQLKAFAPAGTELDQPMGGMITGKTDDGTICFVVNMEATEESSVDAAACDAAVEDFESTYDGVTNVQKEVLADGYVFTAQNEPEIGGTNYWMQCRRFFESKGKAWEIQATAASAEQQAFAAAFAKSVHDAP